MSIQLFQTAKMILNRYLVPDMVRVIMYIVKNYYVEQGLKKHQDNIIKINLEYKNTWRFCFDHQIDKGAIQGFLFQFSKRDKCITDEDFDCSDDDWIFIDINYRLIFYKESEAAYFKWNHIKNYYQLSIHNFINHKIVAKIPDKYIYSL
jgi:hypothetical protein